MTRQRSLRVIRLFISSTFADMQRERTLLQSRVFPAIHRQCTLKGWRFEAIDLRWGITAQQTANNLTLDICVAEVERCRDISPRPNLLILCGQRYGWIPLPDTLPATIFDTLLQLYPNAAEALRACYRLDSNSVEPRLCLLPLSLVDPTLLSSCRDCIAAHADSDPVFSQRYYRSATESEIVKGLFENPDTYDSTILYCRRLTDIPPTHRQLYIQEPHRQRALESRLRDTIDPTATLETTTPFSSYDNGDSDQAFVDGMTRIISDIAAREMERFASLDTFSEEDLLQTNETLLRSANFPSLTPRPDTLAPTMRDNPITLIEGSPANDSGALVAHHMLGRDDAVLLHCAISRRSVSGIGLLRSMLFRLTGERDDTSDFADLSRKVRTALSDPSSTVNIIAFNNIDKLPADDEFFSFSWLPSTLAAPGLKVILCAEDTPPPGMRHSTRPHARIIPGPVSPTHLHTAIVGRLAARQRRLTPPQSDYLLHLLRNTGSPLPQMFDIMVSRMSLLHSWDIPPAIPANPDQALSFFWEALTDPIHNHPLFSRLALALLLYIPSGITDDELLGILALDSELFGQLNNSFGHQIIVNPDQSPSIPLALWPRLYHQLSAVMVCGRSSKGVYNTLHNNIVSRSLEQFLGPRLKTRVLALALDYFSAPSRLQSARSLELRPWLLDTLGHHDQLFRLLTDDSFCNAKIAASMIHLLQDDLTMAASHAHSQHRRDTLLDRHAFVKSESPTLQLYCPIAPSTFARQYERYLSHHSATVGDCAITHTRLVRHNSWRLTTASSTRLLIVDNQETVAYCTLYDIATMKTVASVDIPLPLISDYPNTPPFRPEIKHITLSADGTLAAILGSNGIVARWNIADGTLEQQFILGTDNLPCHPGSPIFLGQRLCFYASNHWDDGGRIFIGDTTVPDTGSYIPCDNLFPSPDGTAIYAVSKYGDHLIIDLTGGTPRVSFHEVDTADKGPFRGDWQFLAYDHASGHLYFRRYDHPAPIGIFDLTTSTVMPNIIAPSLTDLTFSAWVSPRHHILALSDRHNRMHIYSIDSGALLAMIPTDDTEQLTLIPGRPDDTFITQGRSLIHWRLTPHSIPAPIPTDRHPAPDNDLFAALQ